MTAKAPRYIVNCDFLSSSVPHTVPEPGDVVIDDSDLDQLNGRVYIAPNTTITYTDHIIVGKSTVFRGDTYVMIPKSVTAMHDFQTDASVFIAFMGDTQNTFVVFETRGDNPVIERVCAAKLDPNWTCYISWIRGRGYPEMHVHFYMLDGGKVACASGIYPERIWLQYADICMPKVTAVIDRDDIDTEEALKIPAVRDMGYKFGIWWKSRVIVFEAPHTQKDELVNAIQATFSKKPTILPIDRTMNDTHWRVWCDNAEFRWILYYERTRGIATAMHALGLPSWCLLWIINLLPDMHRWPDSLKIGCIMRVYESIARVKEARLTVNKL